MSVYLTDRDFVDNLKDSSAIDGVIVVDKALMANKSVFYKVIVTYRYGREEDEMMGLHFAKEFVLIDQKIDVPTTTSPLVTKLMSKVGANSQPFKISVPSNSPLSVTVETSDIKVSKNVNTLNRLV